MELRLCAPLATIWCPKEHSRTFVLSNIPLSSDLVSQADIQEKLCEQDEGTIAPAHPSLVSLPGLVK